ncbi:MAG: LuxR C-terminal-related transcriptional regulator [Armatimonadota bacterium]|nr:LuxR C-terminal-related transcriptional regulator [Armatimonadota bacterium]MDR7463306.1 LuxR C-terminal-related transcriptional regulator [Armatimonadota bacterium]MDR7474005.1 LuxR C-terminal-related transcriptional regulator [Armatimonadota bacterium]
MAGTAEDIIARVAFQLANRSGPLTHEQEVEFGRALAELAERIERAAEILRQLVELGNPQFPTTDLHLTSRELEMLTHLAEGRSNAEIAKLCWISENTVKFRLKNLFRKLGVRDRGQAMMIGRAMRSRLDPSRNHPSDHP